MLPPDLYRPANVRALFDRMAGSYGIVNMIASLGFCARWRRQCVAAVTILPGAHVHDWLSGMGELWPHLAQPLGATGQITALDFSDEMCRRAVAPRGGPPLTLLCHDVLDNGLPDACADVLVSAFGLKTFSPTQRGLLAAEMARVLRPGGAFALVEIAVPRVRWLRWCYRVYLHHVIPQIGRLFLGDPESYRMLGRYTDAFGDGHDVLPLLRAAGLDVQAEPLFFGCAVRITGTRPA